MLHISEYGGAMLEPCLGTQSIALGASSAPFMEETRNVRLYADEDCWIDFGGGRHKLKAGQSQVFAVAPGLTVKVTAAETTHPDRPYDSLAALLKVVQDPDGAFARMTVLVDEENKLAAQIAALKELQSDAAVAALAAREQKLEAEHAELDRRVTAIATSEAALSQRRAQYDEDLRQLAIAQSQVAALQRGLEAAQQTLIQREAALSARTGGWEAEHGERTRQLDLREQQIAEQVRELTEKQQELALREQQFNQRLAHIKELQWN